MENDWRMIGEWWKNGGRTVGEWWENGERMVERKKGSLRTNARKFLPLYVLCLFDET